MSLESRGYPIPKEAVINFGIKIATAIDKVRSSQTFFLLQQAYPEFADDWEWNDFQELIDLVLNKQE